MQYQQLSLYKKLKSEKRSELVYFLEVVDSGCDGLTWKNIDIGYFGPDIKSVVKYSAYNFIGNKPQVMVQGQLRIMINRV